ncbi:MAG: alanyl-tRNA editing protein [Rhodobiaceae bacterium]|nr:alanyl-tRNA editing protein [Rhodobiaceae bacterium]
MTEALFRDDAYMKTATATVDHINDRGGIVLDRSIFYGTSGGQPGDCGLLRRADGSEIAIATAVLGDDKAGVILVPAEGAALPDPGENVETEIDWERRYRHMRMHTALHLLSVVLKYPVTGGSIGADESRLDFDIPDAGLDKDEITAAVNALIATDYPVTDEWITDAELDANPGLVKTMSVQPPRGSGRIRLVRIGDVDLQPCGGTHVRRTSEIGEIVVSKIEKKGRQNRRVRIRFAGEDAA